MNVAQSSLHHALKNILEKNIEAYQHYSTAAVIAKNSDVQLFFKNKAYNKSLFNEKLMQELNINETPLNSLETLAEKKYDEGTDLCDEILLMQSLKSDKQTLMDFEKLLMHPELPISIRLIIKEQIIFIRLDELKLEQLNQIL